MKSLTFTWGELLTSFTFGVIVGLCVRSLIEGLIAGKF